MRRGEGSGQVGWEMSKECDWTGSVGPTQVEPEFNLGSTREILRAAKQGKGNYLICKL